MQIPLPQVMPKFTVFRLIAGLIIKLVGLWGYYFLLIGLTVILSSRYIIKAYKNQNYETCLLIVIFMFILIGGIIALVNN